jgi:hypothetical protein
MASQTGAAPNAGTSAARAVDISDLARATAQAIRASYAANTRVKTGEYLRGLTTTTNRANNGAIKHYDVGVEQVPTGKVNKNGEELFNNPLALEYGHGFNDEEGEQRHHGRARPALVVTKAYMSFPGVRT